MRQRVRKLVGTVALLALITIYALIVMALAATTLPSLSGLGHLAFFVVAGLLWVIPAGFIITWMQRPDQSPTDELS